MLSEFFRRLKLSPRWTTEILLTSLLVNILALGSSLYSIQVLNRYMALGIDSTLITLTLGVLLAVLFEILLRKARLKISQIACYSADQSLSRVVFAGLGLSEYQLMARFPVAKRREFLTGLQNVTNAFSAVNLNTICDAPFSLVFLCALYWISPKLTFYMAILIGLVGIFSLYQQFRMRSTTEQISQDTLKSSALAQFLITQLETTRTFNAQTRLLKRWKEDFFEGAGTKSKLQVQQNSVQQASYSGSVLTTIIIYGLGAREVMLGNLNIGTLIGASILANRALSNITRTLQLGDTFVKARHGLGLIAALGKITLERDSGHVPSEFQGKLELKDLAFQYPEAKNPVFESFDLEVPRGAIIAVRGSNGSGKTTLARILSGLMQPSRGQILVDGTELSQLVPEWWRKQLVYLPQEPGFLEISLLENLRINAPERSQEEVLQCCNQLGLGAFLNQLEEGLEHIVRGGGAQLPVGIRRRLAFVRAMLTGGQLVVLDEPTEGIDPEGCKAISQILNQMVHKKLTLVLMTNDPFVLDVAHLVVDLDSKPKPEVSNKSSTVNREKAS